MAVLTVSGEPGCPVEEVARRVAQELDFEIFDESAVLRMVEEHSGPDPAPDKAWAHLLNSILARLATQHNLVASMPGAEFLLRQYPDTMRTAVVAPQSYRAGMIMLDRGLERPEANSVLKEADRGQRDVRRRRFGRATAPPHLFDLTLNAAGMESDSMAAVIAAAAGIRGLAGLGRMPASVEAGIQFQARLQLARYRLRPPAQVGIERKVFYHPSEEIFANLLDFYRIAWEYEPRSFPLEWDETGAVLEAFTPDFYLPEFDLYVELTTMKQALVTKKNRKVRRLRRIYPEVNIQVFYQKDFQNLIFKYGLTDRTMQL